MSIPILALGAYLVGSISFAVIVSRVYALPDPRTYGSGNPGATNVLRTGRRAAAALVLLGDGAKGWLAVFLAQHLAAPDAVALAMASAAVAVVIGHMYPVFFRFKGGKGVACGLGTFLALAPAAAGIAAAVCIVVVVITRVGSLGSLLGAAALLPALYLLHAPLVYLQLAAAMFLLIVWRHRDNLGRMLRGSENKL